MNTNLSRAVDDVEVKEFLRDNQKRVEEIFVASFVDAHGRAKSGSRYAPTNVDCSRTQ